jgi:hypothetical protein
MYGHQLPSVLTSGMVVSTTLRGTSKMVRHGFFDQYAAPDSDTSLYKNIPISLRDHAFIKGMLAVGCRVVYRGPRTNRGTHSTLKRDANAFSIYPPSPRWDHTKQRRSWPWESVHSNAVWAQHYAVWITANAGWTAAARRISVALGQR